MSDISIREIFRVASERMGGPQALARSLGAAEFDVQAWIEGRLAPPFGAALRAAQMASQAQEQSSSAPDALRRAVVGSIALEVED